MPSQLDHVYERLYAYCEQRGFAGHDPFDGLNSHVFQMTPLKRSRLARLAWLQTLKRLPLNLRPALRIPEGVNPKAIALFALAELSRLRATGDTDHAENAGELLEILSATSIKSTTPAGGTAAGYGYNFDWQSRAFYAPRGTAAVVPTAFACRAIVEAYGAFRDDSLLNAADEICAFILTCLNRPVDDGDEISFSYTPLDNSVVYNASLLAGESLAAVGQLTQNSKYLKIASRAARFVIKRQRADGAWVYGAAGKQQWVDNFHTAYVLLSLNRIADAIPDMGDETAGPLKAGIDYWLDNFFLQDGTPKYYANKLYPIDIHSPAAAIAVMSELRTLDPRLLPMARKVAEWTVHNMLDERGFFYYQLRRGRIVKTPFMRWGQAWMAYALARLIEAEAIAAPG